MIVFSYNLVQLIGELTDGNIKVVRNDEITIDEIRKMNPESIIYHRDRETGRCSICEDVVRQLKDEYPILGVCLGHQSICEVFGAKVTYAKQLMHGKQSEMTILKEDPIFEGLGESFKGARYHSLSADRNTIPDELEVIAIDEKDGEVMAVKHKEYPIYGLQFHPESVLTPEGKTLVNNFLKLNN